MKHFLLWSCLLITLNAAAQDETIKKLQSDANVNIKKDPNDTIPRLWRTGGTFGLTLSQGSLSNWAAGGDDFSLSLNLLTSYYAFYKKNRNSWDNTIDFNLGYVKTTSLGSRKNDDRFDLVSKYGYALTRKLNLGMLFNFRTQFFKGYTYAADGTKTYASNFLAPGYVLLSPGLDYKPTQNLSIFISPATVRWVIVKDDALSARGLYGVDTGQHVKTEIGAFLSVNYMANLGKSVTYKGRMDLFSNYKHEPQNVDLYMTNLFAVKLSKYLSATWSLDLIYDDDVKLFGTNKNAAALQIKSLIGAGFLVKFAH